MCDNRLRTVATCHGSCNAYIHTKALSFALISAHLVVGKSALNVLLYTNANLCIIYVLIMCLNSRAGTNKPSDEYDSYREYWAVFTLTPFLGDNKQLFKNGRCFSNLSASRGRSFCGSSNRLVSLLYTAVVYVSQG